ncbi:MAG TPA: ABC transporter substrate-binding protein [Chloroflexota bacterium]
MDRAPLIHHPFFSRRGFLQMTAAGAASAAAIGGPLAAHAAGRASSPKRGGILRMGSVGDVPTFDGPLTSSNNAIWTMVLLYDQLTRPSKDGLSVEPSLATSWDISPDGKTYTFHLRKGVTFHDGSPMTAEDVKFSVERAVNLKNSQWSFLFGAFKSMEVVDTHTVRAHLSAPHAPFLSDVALFATSVLPKKLVESMGEKFFDHPIGTGPFMFKSWSRGSQLVLARNPHSFRAPMPYLDEFHNIVVPDPNTRVLQVQNGELDVAMFVPPAATAGLAGNPAVTLHTDQFFDSHFITIQTTAKPYLRDKLVRQAMNYAIDKNAIVKVFLYGHGEASGLALPKMYGYTDSIQPYPYDLNMAKSLLKKSSFPNGFSTVLLVDASTAVPDKQIAEYVQQQLGKIGIKVSIVLQPDAVNLAATQSPHYEMNVGYMTSDIIDPDELVSFAMGGTPGGTNSIWTYYNNPTVNSLAARAAGILDRGQRQKLYDQANQIFHDDAPMIFLYRTPSLTLTSSKVQGFKVLPTGNYRIEEVYFSS